MTQPKQQHAGPGGEEPPADVDDREKQSDNRGSRRRRDQPATKEPARDPREDPTKRFPGLGRHDRQDLGHAGQQPGQHKK